MIFPALAALLALALCLYALAAGALALSLKPSSKVGWALIVVSLAGAAAAAWSWAQLDSAMSGGFLPGGFLHDGALPGWRTTLASAVLAAGAFLSAQFWVLLTLARRAGRRRSQAGEAPHYIVVLGAGLKGRWPTRVLQERLERAIELRASLPEPPPLLLSGGRGADEPISEAQAMCDYVRFRGIDADQVLLEEESTSTRENLANSLALAERSLPAVQNPVSAGWARSPWVVTSDYHVLRAQVFADRLAREHARQGESLRVLGARSNRCTWPSAFLREYAALLVCRKQLNLAGFALLWAAFLRCFG